jgi:hypothetical protein
MPATTKDRPIRAGGGKTKAGLLRQPIEQERARE